MNKVSGLEAHFWNILFHIISWNDWKSFYIFHIVHLKTWEQESDKRKTPRIPTVLTCVYLKYTLCSKPLIRSTGSLSVCRLSVGVSRTSAASCTHSITHLIKSPACLYARYSGVRKAARLHSYRPFSFENFQTISITIPAVCAFLPKAGCWIWISLFCWTPNPYAL